MTTQHHLRQPTVHRLPQLIEELKTGALRIPPFQRDFIWDGEQRLHLFDSIAKGLPLGSLMVWRTTMSLQTDPRLGPIELSNPEPTPGLMRQYLLDGRQRLTTLFAALGPGLWTRLEQQVPPGFDGEAPDGTPWSVAYDLDKTEFTLSSTDDLYLPLAILLDDYSLDIWLSQNAKKNRSWYRNARALKSALYDYLIPITPLHTDDLDSVTLTFKRVNRAGTTMGDLEMARALSWTAGGFDLATEIGEMIDSLAGVGWSGLDPDTVLKVLAAAGGQGPSEMNVEKLATQLRGQKVLLSRVRDTLEWTVRILNKMGISGPKTLPWRFVLVAVARVKLEFGELDPSAKQRLMGWIAESCLSEAFGSAPPHILRALHKELIGVVTEGRGRRTRSARRSRRFSMAWARSRVTAVALANLEPRGADGNPLFSDASAEVGRRGKDAMPFLFAKGEGFSRQVQDAISGLSDILKQSAANRVLCNPVDLPNLRRALERQDPDVCRSHSAPTMSMGNIREWLSARDDLIKETEISWLVEMGGAKAKVTWKNEGSLANTR